MSDAMLLQVLHHAKESLSKIPDLTFLVREIDILSLGDFSLQIVTDVLIQQPDGVERRAEFVLFRSVVIYQLDKVRVNELLPELGFTGDELKLLCVLDSLIDSSELLLSSLVD